MNLIQIENLSYSYSNTKALENINLEIKSDDFLAIIGPNGGGKSTLFKLILELLPLQSGRLIKNIKNSEVGYVPQNTNLNIDEENDKKLNLILKHKIKKYLLDLNTESFWRSKK